MEYIIVAEWPDGYRLTVCPNDYSENILANKAEAEDVCTDIYEEMAMAGMVGADLPELTIHSISKAL